MVKPRGFHNKLENSPYHLLSVRMNVKRSCEYMASIVPAQKTHENGNSVWRSEDKGASAAAVTRLGTLAASDTRI